MGRRLERAVRCLHGFGLPDFWALFSSDSLRMSCNWKKEVVMAGHPGIGKRCYQADSIRDT